MSNAYANVRRQHRTIETERDLRALWRRERFESEAAVEHALRVYEMAIRVDGWATVAGWARDALADGRILNTQLVELAMRALEQPDDAFFIDVVDHLLQRAPANYFKFWHALFVARHSHRGERLMRGHLAKVSDYQLVKYRRWVRKIFRKLRFRCKTDRERAIAAIAFGVYKDYDKAAYPSEVFTAYIKAHAAARTRPVTKQGKDVPKARHAELFAEAAAPLRMWSIAEGIRTSARLPRTLKYLNRMAPTLSDIELLRALKAFDKQLMTADHKKASELVAETAEHITMRLGKMTLPIEEWAKIYPYQGSPVLQRVLETILGERFDGAVEALSGKVDATLIPIVDAALDARACRTAFLTAYVAHRSDPEGIAYLVRSSAHAQSLSHASATWPYGIGVPPPTSRFQAEPDHPHRLGFALIAELFVAIARQKSPAPGSLDMMLRCLRAHVRRRVVVDGGVGPRDVPVLFFGTPPAEEDRAALVAALAPFPAAVLALFEQRWDPPVAADNAIHVELPRAVDGATDKLLAALDDVGSRGTAHAERKDALDREARELLLWPPDRAVVHVTRPAR
ncbi:MAG: hypothetical protein AAF721_19315 [Myxococcota bacterium]